MTRTLGLEEGGGIGVEEPYGASPMLITWKAAITLTKPNPALVSINPALETSP